MADGDDGRSGDRCVRNRKRGRASDSVMGSRAARARIRGGVEVPQREEIGMYCAIHEHLSHGSCKLCRSETAKRNYTKANPYSRGSSSIDLPDHGVVRTMEELSSIHPSEWGENEYREYRINIASRNTWNDVPY